MENKRFITGKGFVVFMIIMGTLVGLFAILCKHNAVDPAVRSLSDWIPFSTGFIPVLIIMILIGSRKAGNGNKIPIR